MDWKQKVFEKGWYWVWHDCDWVYENRKPKLIWIYGVEKREDYEDYALARPDFRPSGVLVGRKELFDTYIFDGMTWFYGPIDLKPPPPPLPSKKYEKEIQRDIAHYEEFEGRARLWGYKDERYNKGKAEAEKNLAEAKEKLDKILKLRGKST
jgi:hypothetical protein